MSPLAERGVNAAAGTPLLRALARTGPAFTVETTHARRWASATFAGERQVIVIAAADTPELDDWLAALPEAEWDLPRVLVADLAAVAVTRADGRVRVTIEALLLDRA